MTQGWGDHIRSARKAKNLTQDQLADLLGVSQVAISEWEREVSYPSKLRELCGALGIQLDSVVAFQTTTSKTEQAIWADTRLTRAERQAMVTVYQAMVEGRHDGQFGVKLD